MGFVRPSPSQLTVSLTERFVPNEKIQTIFVPQYKNLSIERILEFIADKPDILDFMPDDIGK